MADINSIFFKVYHWIPCCSCCVRFSWIYILNSQPFSHFFRWGGSSGVRHWLILCEGWICRRRLSQGKWITHDLINNLSFLPLSSSSFPLRVRQCHEMRAVTQETEALIDFRSFWSTHLVWFICASGGDLGFVNISLLRERLKMATY